MHLFHIFRQLKSNLHRLHEKNYQNQQMIETEVYIENL